MPYFFHTLLCCLVISCATNCARASLILSEITGSPYQASSILGNATEGDDMAGMSVTVTFSDLTFETITWAATGLGTGEAMGTDWRLDQGPGSTWSNAFNFVNRTGKTVSQLTLHGAPANTVFDRTFTGTGTPGSANGKDVLESGTTISNAQDVLAEYHDKVNLTGSGAVGDLFAGLKFTFTAGLANNSVFSFITDTDNTTTQLVPSPVPEPSGCIPLACCLLLGYANRRRR